MGYFIKGDNMQSVKNYTKERLDDIEMMLNIIDADDAKIDYQLMLKSSVILMIYNSIEGTMSTLMEVLFDSLNRKELSLKNLPKKLKKIILKYHLKTIGNKADKLEGFAKNYNEKNCDISYLEINKYLNLFSGNLDSRRIKEISEEFGIYFDLEEPFLLKVKNIRNSLSHGEKSFRVACQDYTVNELKEGLEKTRTYLDKLIEAYGQFIQRLTDEESLR